MQNFPKQMRLWPIENKWLKNIEYKIRLKQIPLSVLELSFCFLVNVEKYGTTKCLMAIYFSKQTQNVDFIQTVKEGTLTRLKQKKLTTTTTTKAAPNRETV